MNCKTREAGILAARCNKTTHLMANIWIIFSKVRLDWGKKLKAAEDLPVVECCSKAP